MQSIRSALDHIRETYTPVKTTSTFRETGQITPEEFIQAGDFIVYKFPSWSWADAASPKHRVSYLPAGKQYLVTRGVPCRRRLDENFAGGAGLDADIMVGDGEGFRGRGDAADDGWLRTGGEGERRGAQAAAAGNGDVRTVDDAGEMGERVVDEDDIPDMEDEDDDEEAIIRDPKAEGANSPLRTYTLYIAYSPYYRTPRLYLSGYQSLTPGAPSTPLAPTAMMEDIVADYKDKTVTLEDFSFVSPPIKTASVHPCRHASVMKVLLDRADAALKIRTAKLRRGLNVTDQGMEGLVDKTGDLNVSTGADDGTGAGTGEGTKSTSEPSRTEGMDAARDGDEWEEVLAHDSGASPSKRTTTKDGHEPEDAQNAIRVDQYLVVFLKFMASVTPGIEHDYTMGV